MTAPLRATPRLSALPASQNTAPVAEFRCLFTHDVRRKQKRWQDGYLKFHSFNNRVMVYDISRNFLGDTYWKESDELHEGDELTLDKGIMVEVADAMAVTQTDLTPLFERKPRESPQRNHAAAPQRPLPKVAVPANNTLQSASQLRHKSLNALLGTPRGPIGKAVPMKSPFEARKEKENHCDEQGPSKRQKTAHRPDNHQDSCLSAGKEPVSRSSLPQSAKTPNSSSVRRPTRPLPRGATIINLDSEPDHISSDVTLPCTPPRISTPIVRPSVSSVSVSNRGVTEQPQVRTPKLPKGRVPVPHVKAQETPRPPPPPSSPPVSASNRLSNVEVAVEPTKKPQKEPSPPQSPPRNPKAKSLRLAAGVKRSTLLCQSVPQQRAKDIGEQRAPADQTARKASHDSLRHDATHSPFVNEHSDQPKEQSRSARVTTKKKKSSRTRQSPVQDEPKHAEPETTPHSPFGTFDDMEMMHGLMDQQLLVTSSPPRLPTNSISNQHPPTKAPKPKSIATESATNEVQCVAEEDIINPAPRGKIKNKLATQEKERPRKRKKQPEKANPTRQPSPPAAVPEDPCIDGPSPPIASASPKLVPLSTGGFNKRTRHTQPASAKPGAPEPRPSNTTLPPHPLRASRPGAVMSRTELSTMLQKGPKSANLEDDPIEDSTQGEKSVSTRNFQRSRSENDTPIPSTSDEWEQRNLPNASKQGPNAGEPVREEDAVAQKPKSAGLAALVKKTDPRRKFQRTQSLNVDTNVPAVEEQEVVTPPVDDDIGPWSTEAFDLFEWRPPPREGQDQGIGLLVDKA